MYRLEASALSTNRHVRHPDFDLGARAMRILLGALDSGTSPIAVSIIEET